MEQNPNMLRSDESPHKVIQLDHVLGGQKKKISNLGGSIILDKEERELVKKGDEVTKE